MNTLIVDLYGGPGTGKSTTAAILFAKLKQWGYNAELVREYVKEWAWESRKPGPFDQFYFFGKQSRKESLLYGKVEVIVTDSPVSLSAFYAGKYSSKNTADAIKNVVLAFYLEGVKEGHVHLPVFLTRSKEYNPAGRYQTEEEAKALDVEMLEFLKSTSFDVLTWGTSNADITHLADYIVRVSRGYYEAT